MTGPQGASVRSGAADLKGLGILVTRPEQQSAGLCQLLEIYGATTRRFPALEIQSIGDRPALAARLGRLENFDLIIFTSANAVRFGASLLEEKRDLALAAIGPATANALHQAGYRVAMQPSGNVDSEGLLAHPRLAQISGQRILIIKGSQGRQLLEQQLVCRGALVATADVYRRLPVNPAAGTLSAVQEAFAAGELHVVTATSVEIAKHLLAVATPALRGEFERARWLLPSERVAASVREAGLRAPVLVAESAEDQDLVAALVRWRSSVSGA